MNQLDAMKLWVLLVLLVCPSLQFSIRRRGTSYKNGNPYDLQEALSALDRQRRRIEEAELFPHRQPDDDDAFFPSPKRTSNLPYNYNMGDDSDMYIPVKESELSELLSSYQNPFQIENAASHRTIPSLGELQQIFVKDEDQLPENIDESDDQGPIINTADVDDHMPEAEAAEEETINESIQNEDGENDKLLESTDVIDEEDDMRANNDDKPPTEEVSKEELETVFSNQDTKVENIPTIQESDEIKRSDGDMGENDMGQAERYGLLKNFLENMNENKRRMTKRENKVGKSQSEKDLRAKIKKLKGQLEKLKLMQMMEDKENDYLASALKGATLSQLQGSGSFLKGEFDDIQNAIKLEEMLQQVKFNDDEEEEDSSYSKRTDNQLEDSEQSPTDKGGIFESLDDSLGRWYDEPVKSDVDGGAFLKPSIYGDDQLFLEEFAKQNSPESKREWDVEQIEVPVTEETEFDEGLEKLNNILGTLTPDERDELRYQVENIMAQEETSDECAAATLLSSDCQFADALQLPIDEEARNLCNRHEVCYICAETFGMTDVQCDSGYRADAMAICGDDEKCDEDANLFLGLMHEKHRYIPYGNEFCSAPCVKDYIIGL